LKSRDEPEPTYNEYDACDDRRDDQPDARQHDIQLAPAPLAPMQAKYTIHEDPIADSAAHKV